jgi:hypothetical protein
MKLGSLRHQSARIGARGLIVAGTVQVFRFEQGAQTRFARLASRAGLPVINVGYGCGFAHTVLIERPGAQVTLIEANSRVCRWAARAHGSDSVIFHAPWQLCLHGVVPAEMFDIYFDAFPHFRNFDYSPRAFRRYISEFLRSALKLPRLGTAYFVVLDRSAIHFPVARGWYVRRISTVPVPQRYRTPMFSRISLYAACRVKATPELETEARNAK